MYNVQFHPMLTAQWAAAVARSLVSSKTMTGDFPPSSKMTFFKFEAAAAATTLRAVATEPVTAIIRIRMWFASAEPTSAPP
jgi:hypothetical protein